MVKLDLSGIKAGGSTLVPRPTNPSSNTLKVGNLNTNPALNVQTPITTTPVNPQPQAPNPANTLNLVTPQTSTVPIPTKIPSDTLSYTSPQGSSIDTPVNNNLDMTTATVNTYANQPVETPPVLSDYDKRMKSMMDGINMLTDPEKGYSATSLKLQQEGGLSDKQERLKNLDLQDQALQAKYKTFEANLLNKNPQGIFGTGGQQLLDQEQRDNSLKRMEILIEKGILTNNIATVQDNIKLKLDTVFEPVKQRLDYMQKYNTIYNANMSDTEKAQASLEEKQLTQVIKEKEDFKKYLDEAGLAGAGIDVINQAQKAFANGDRAGAISALAPYSKKAQVDSLTPYQKFQATQSIAKDTQARTANAREMARQAKLIQDSYNNVLKGGDRSLNTQAIITSFNKILDPTSVVRESEYDRTAQGQALVEQLRGKVDSIVAGGSGVTEATLKEAADIAKQYLTSSQASIKEENDRAKAMADQFGLNSDFVGSTGTTEEVKMYKGVPYVKQSDGSYKKQSLTSVGSDTNRATGGKEIVAGYDITSYATDPTHGVKVNKIFSQIPQVQTEMDVNSYIRKVAPNSPVKGSFVVNASNKYGVDPRLILAIMVQDSTIGTAGKAVRTKNPGNVGNTDSGATKTFASWEQGVDAVAKNLAWRKINQA